MPFPLFNMQDREIIRVIVDCCLQEKMFNKYYTVLASKLCSHEKNHKFSLQVYCYVFIMFVTYVNASEITLLLIAHVGLFYLIPFRIFFSLINNHIGETL
jgi:hypothetical protein